MRLPRRIMRVVPGFFLAASVPQPEEHRTETMHINRWLERRRLWLSLCIVLWAMRRRIGVQPTWVKEVREFSERCEVSWLEQRLRGMSKRFQET